ncbi:MAG: amino acid transporter ATPase [Microbacteriaceae bacterium]|nr:amino acid transporter ATPase [Microbacteriaceae bacterium]
MILEIEGLVTGYRDVVAVHGVDLSVDAGSVTALLGRNGAGKTTTLHCIAGLLPTMKGSIRLDSRELSTVKAPHRAGLGVGLVQEGKRVFKGISVDQNLVMGAYSARLRRAELESRKEAMYERFPMLQAKRNSLAGSLSGGQQQMLAIGQVLMSAPRVLMLDEPSAGLAPTITAQILDIIKQLRSEGIGILLVEQSVEFALACADTVTVINLGRNVFTGASDDPTIRGRIAAAFMGNTYSG